MESELPFPFGIPPAAPRLPRRHSDDDIDIIIRLLEEIQNFLGSYINYYLEHLIPDDLLYLVPDFQQRMVPIINQKAHEIVSAFTSQATTDSQLKIDLRAVELTDQSLEFKDRTIRGLINRFVNLARQVRGEITQGSGKAKAEVIKGLNAVADPVFKVINSFLGSLKAATGTIPGVGAALDVIKEIKDYLDAASTSGKEHMQGL
jgi:hypothetical protein